MNIFARKIPMKLCKASKYKKDDFHAIPDISFDLKDRPHINYKGNITMLKQRLTERLKSLIEQEIGWKENESPHLTSPIKGEAIFENTDTENEEFFC